MYAVIETGGKQYRVAPGDEIRVESFSDEKLNGNLIVQPDGTITLRLLGQVRATHRTVTQLRDEIDKASMFEEIVGESPSLRAVLGRVAKVAPSPLPGDKRTCAYLSD